jgi:AcrR family transcriptional regulator
MHKGDIQRAALFRFAKQGYHATTLRHLTNDLGVTPAAFYYHFKSKDELLTSLIEEIISQDLEMLLTIRRENVTNPLDELLYANVYNFCAAREEGLIVTREARYLEEEFRNRVARVFHDYNRVFADCIAEEYDLSGAALALAARAVVGLGGSVLLWFHQDGPLSAHEVALTFTRYARGILDRAEQNATKTPWSRQRRNGSRNESAPLSFEDTVALINQRAAAWRRVSAAA